LLAHALVAAFTIFIIWWGVRQASKALVNLGIIGFAIAVGWFYFSDIFDKVGRSLGLIGLGVLFPTSIFASVLFFYLFCFYLFSEG
jgi:TRAP-type C4-dicarboxylate transport system permease small subunit